METANAVRCKECGQPVAGGYWFRYGPVHLGCFRLIQPRCWCETCDVSANGGLRSRMSVCPQCGDKRCPRAEHHDNVCSKTTNV